MDLRRGKFDPGSCTICGTADARLHCARCGGALCHRHRHHDGDRCELCENDYETRFATRDGALYLGVVLAFPGLICLAALAALSVPGVGIAVAATVVGASMAFLAKGFPWARRRLSSALRRRFLGETPLPRARLVAMRGPE